MLIPGLVLSRSIPSWIRMVTHLAGLRMDSLDLKVRITVGWVLTRCMDVPLLKLITAAVSTPASPYPEPMLKSCPDSGSIRSVQLKGYIWVISCGYQDTFYREWLRILVWW